MFKKLINALFKKNVIVLKKPERLQRDINLEKDVNHILKKNEQMRKKL